VEQPLSQLSAIGTTVTRGGEERERRGMAVLS